MTDQRKAAKAEEECPKKLAEVTEKWKRAVADYKNFQRRVEKERQRTLVSATAVVVATFLPVLDSLEKAAAHSKDTGLQGILKQFREVLEKNGVSEISEEGVPFDPRQHEAVEVVEGEKANRVVRVIRKGFRLGEVMIRPAQVAVSRLEAEKDE